MPPAAPPTPAPRCAARRPGEQLQRQAAEPRCRGQVVSVGGSGDQLLARASAAAFVLARGVGGLSAAVASSSGAGAGVVRAAAATTTAAVALPLLLVVHRHHLPTLALGRPRQAVAGAAVVFGVDAVLGGSQVTAVDVPALLLFLVTNTALALALEALPEEVTFAPGGQDPVAYTVLLVVFGVMLLLARGGDRISVGLRGGPLGVPHREPEAGARLRLRHRRERAVSSGR